VTDVATEAPYWGREKAPDAAYERLLDAAGRVFADKGVAAARMGEVAAAAGCSRGTLYRYFTGVDALRLAFVEREALRVGGRVASRVAGIADPAEMLVAACLRSLGEVRADPILSAWFAPASSGLTGEVAGQAVSIGRLVDGLLAALAHRASSEGAVRPDLDRELATDFVVRVLLSLLARPAGPSEEALLRQCLLPALFVTPAG
jgi:AcrR family transcriptional regulator